MPLTRASIQWLDHPLAALQGRTPREACKTAEGRKTVEIMIRTIPTPVGPVPIDVDAIRKELLDALGLGGEK